ncbi:MAG: DPP IV N-terminal domain-containing protein [Steroidobacteraceae bacterium]
MIRIRALHCCFALAASLALSSTAVSELHAEPSAQDEAIYQSYLDFGRLVEGGRVVPHWLPDGSSFWYAEGGPNDRKIIKVDAATDTSVPFFDAAQLRSVLTETLGHEPAGNGIPFENFQFDGQHSVNFSLEGSEYALDLDQYELTRQIPPSSSSNALVISEAERAVPGTFMREKFVGIGRLPSPESMSPDGRWIAGIEDHDVVMRATVDGQKVSFTDDDTRDAFWDVEATLWNPWSPDSQKLAVFKQHTKGLARIPSIKWLIPLAQAMEVVTVPAGGALYRSELYLVDMFRREPLPVDLGDMTNQYLRILTWLPDGSELIIARYNRVMSRVRIQAVNAATRVVRTILTEESDTFLTNQHEAIWATETGFTLLPDGSGFIWNSERSGWDHLYRYDMNGKLMGQLTRGEWPVKDVMKVDQQGGWVYFTGHGDQSRPYDTHLYRVGLNGKRMMQLTEGKGQHAANIAPSAAYFVDTYSAVDVPPKTVLRKTDGTLIRTLGEADISRLKEVGWTPPQECVVKATDGETDLWATLYFPYDFDPESKYPVVEYIYAGPQIAVRPMDFGDDAQRGQANFNRALSNLGFIVVSLDARGTPERSKAFHDMVYMNWGQFEIDDHAGALRQLGERLGFLDLDRVGIWGLSWGGHFAFRALTQAPDLYKVGISEVPGFDPRSFILYEPYLGMPQANKATYDAADPFALARQLKGELLLIGGINDTATQADVFKMSETLIRLGKQHRTMIYPNSGHGAVGKTGEYDLELKKRFFVEHLQPDQGQAGSAARRRDTE